MKSVSHEQIANELSEDVQDLMVREAHVRHRQQRVAAELDARRAQLAGLEGTRPAFLMFRHGAKTKFTETAARLREEIVAAELALEKCNLILKKSDKIIVNAVENCLEPRSAQFRDLQLARKLLPGWQSAVGLYGSCLKRFITALGIARNQMLSGYNRKAGEFTQGAKDAFAAAVMAAKSLEAEASIPNKMAQRQRELLGLDPAPKAPVSGGSAALPYVLGDGLTKQVATFATSTLEEVAMRIGALIEECERLHVDGIPELLVQVARIEALLDAQWERQVAAPLVELRAMADAMVEDQKLESVYAQMEARFVTLTA